MKKILLAILILILSPLIYTGWSCSYSSDSSIQAVWWWNDSLDEETVDTYLQFAKENGINEIYYSSSEFGEETANFISKANDKDIKVFWLDGDYRWLVDSEKKNNLLTKISNYHNYNSAYPNQKFYGIHLDIEPHQSDNFDENREELILSLIRLADELKKDNPSTHFTYDIPFWLEDEITYNNTTKPAYAHIIDIADNVVIMSYRDSAEEIFSVAEDELEYAKSIGKTITLSVECGDHGETISFYEEGKDTLKTELDTLYTLIPKSTGMCIHHIVSWYNLKD